MSYSLRGVSKAYGGRAVLQDVSHDFSDTGVCLVTGPSGRGKTTLLRLIAGLEKPDGGTIAFAGRMTMSFQEYRLFPQLTALQNITALAPKGEEPACLRNAEKLLARLGFSEREMRLRPAALSGGMKQRVSLARALCGDAAVVLLDEPLKELDAALREVVLTLIAEKGEKALVIMTAHEAEIVEGMTHTTLALV